MPFVVIRGTFHVTGYSPDGDSIRFAAHEPSHWALLAGPRPKINGRGHAQLRLEAIDTLETHFQNFHQPMPLAKAAMDGLVAALGITHVQWNNAGTQVVSANDGTTGYIISREVEKNRRPVAFAFTGAPVEADGASIFLTPARLATSVNHHLLDTGLAYPTYYKGLFSDLRAALTAVVTAARQASRGVWAHDVTNTGFPVEGLASLTDQHIVLPKLFRRLAAYLEGGGNVSGFTDYLAALAEEVLIIATSHFTHFDNLIELQGHTVRLKERPENLLFIG